MRQLSAHEIFKSNPRAFFKGNGEPHAFKGGGGINPADWIDSAMDSGGNAADSVMAPVGNVAQSVLDDSGLGNAMSRVLPYVVMAYLGGGAGDAMGAGAGEGMLGSTPSAEVAGSEFGAPAASEIAPTGGFDQYASMSPSGSGSTITGQGITDSPISWDAPTDPTADWENQVGQSWGDSAGASADQNATLSAVNGAGDTGGIGDRLGTMADWMEKHKMASSMMAGAGLGGLQMVGAQAQAKKNAEISKQNQARFDSRQALMDNPPQYSGMNLALPNRSDFSRTATMNPLELRNYGAGPETKHFVAGGGDVESSPMGAFDTMKMVHGHGGGQQDNVPAMLSPKEYVMDADVVAALGDGNPDEGAKRLDKFRENVRTHKRSAPSHKIPPKARSVDSYMKRAA